MIFWLNRFIQNLRGRGDPGKTSMMEVMARLEELVPVARRRREVLQGPLKGVSIPRDREHLIELYGQPPKAKVPRNQRADMVLLKELPGGWNKGSGRLYLLAAWAPVVEAFLHRSNRLGCLFRIERIGSYNHRHIRHDPNRPWSMHAWGAALDIDPAANRPLQHPQLPFSRGWLKDYPDGIPWPMVEVALDLGLTWGGCWGRLKWTQFVRDLGVGYSIDECRRLYPELLQEALDEWGSFYCDPMHIQFASV